MPKLHELLAVEGALRAQAEKTRTELIGTFGKREHHFTEKLVSFRPYEENAQTVVESQLDLQTTVPRELRWVSEFLIKSLDMSYQVAEANTAARADIVLEDGSTLLANIPVTSLLELEKRAIEMRAFVTAIPTLDPAKGFAPDPDKGEGIFKAREERKTRTKKINKVLELSAATKEHKAQVQVVTEDVNVGDIVTLEWSGLITVAAKGDMLSRVEMLARAIKMARARANDADLPKATKSVGAGIVNYVLGLQAQKG